MPFRARALSLALLPLLTLVPSVLPHRALADMAPEPPDAIAPAPRAPKLDVVFVIDATASMGDEIEQVKTHLWQTAQRVMDGTPRPEVRFGIVVYRDRTDAEHTRVVPLTRDVEAIHRALMSIRATGGGDMPEDVDAGLSLAVQEMSWASDAAHMAFLIGDASAQSYGVDRQALLEEARRKEIHIHTIQASGIDPAGVAQFQTLAQMTGGVSEVLTYTRNVRYAGHDVTIMRRGAETWVSRRPLAAADRALSFDEQRARGLVERDDAAAAAFADTGAAERSTRSGARPAARSPAFAPADSDIGGIISREARSAAETRGVAY